MILNGIPAGLVDVNANRNIFPFLACTSIDDDAGGARFILFSGLTIATSAGARLLLILLCLFSLSLDYISVYGLCRLL